ncbi:MULTISPECIES: thermonuclease family protein [Moorena]|uniref:Nuclease n=1 Tax=Moorena bouillonii PNG TaxID=568701 RepID=A0A1U7MYY5_9CYAN|nr:MULTISPECIES: thermonuclease family protein [Moorena]NEO12191.1 thermonuclease family protein [Moorena sp. SIO3E8]NEP97711.1 thermonuclease family protein [Moorena sp. SIO3F7]OLT58917.1 nuclease [Moorena bouillonii PNG]
MNPTRQLIQNIFKSIVASVLILSLFGCAALLDQLGIGNYTVKRVSDGDTILVADRFGKDVKVRFACIDAPEIAHSNKEKQSRKLVDKSQFKWGNKAKERLQELVKQSDNQVVLTVTDTDRYGRSVSEVRLTDGTFVQEVLVKEGLAQVYRPYLKDCPSAEMVDSAEANAKRYRRGLWRDPKFVPAWEYRSLAKTKSSSS